jgi:hypothetical protein
VSFRRLGLLLLVVLIPLAPSRAAAQFATFIPPQNKVADSAKAAVAAAQKAQADSAVNMQLGSMKTWVDSAAGIAPAPATTADSLAQGLPVATPPDTATFNNGARAPETASDLPLLVLLGIASLGVGALLLRGAPRPRNRA